MLLLLLPPKPERTPEPNCAQAQVTIQFDSVAIAFPECGDGSGQGASRIEAPLSFFSLAHK